METALLYSGSTSPSASLARHADDVTESIDYLPVINSVALARQAAVSQDQRKKVFGYGYSGETAIKLTTTLVSGLLIGATAIALESGIEWCVKWRNSLLRPVLLASVSQAFYYQLALSIGAVLLVSFTVQFFAPGAAGSGVSLVMAFLNGNHIAGLLGPRVFLVKSVGICLTRLAGLALGPEAPMVHLGACTASMLCGLERRIWRDKQLGRPGADSSTHAGGSDEDGEVVVSNADHREMVSAGAAAGLAAAFGAPIGGVLFALEEACSTWSRKTAWRCLLCAAVAVFTMSQLAPRRDGLLQLKGVYPLSSRQWLKQLPFVVLVSAGGALLGGTFNLLRGQMLRLRAGRKQHALRLLESAAATVVTVSAIYFISLVGGRCMHLPATWHEGGALQWTCPAGQYNDLATLLMGGPPWVIRSLLALGSAAEPMEAVEKVCSWASPCYYSALSLTLVSVVYLGLMVLAPSGVPGGMFMPSILVGSTFGAVAGLALHAVLPPTWDIQPGIYAIVGATACLGAVFRTSLALTVIVVEGIGGVELLAGIIAAVIVSNFVAHWVHPEGVYESELERDGRVFFLRPEPPGVLRLRSAGSIMASPAVCLPSIVEVSRVLEVLKTTTHNGFPVYVVSRLPEEGASGSQQNSAPRLDGLVLRSQLLVLLNEYAVCNSQGHFLHPASDPVAYSTRLDTLMQTACTSADGLGPFIEELGVDPFTQRNAVALDEEVTFPVLETLPSLTEFVMQPQGTLLPSTPFQPADTRLCLNLEPFMNRAVLSVPHEIPANIVHQMFLSLSLRHLCVTDPDNRLLGIITRKDLDYAAGLGWWRMNKLAPRPVKALQHRPSWLSVSHRMLSGFWNKVSPRPASFSSRDGNGSGALPPEEFMAGLPRVRVPGRLSEDTNNPPAMVPFGSTTFGSF